MDNTNGDWFLDMRHAMGIIENWRKDYNEVEPHTSLNGNSPKEYPETVARLY